MTEPLRVLLVEDSEDDAALTVRELRRGGYSPVVQRVETAVAMRGALAEPWDVVLADYSLPHFDAPSALRVLKESGRDLPFIIVSGAVGEEAAVAAMRAGAQDYVMKDNLARLVPAIRRELGDAEERRRRGEAEAALAQEQEYSRLLVESANALIVVLDVEGRVTVFNPAAEALTGYRRADVLGRDWFALIAPRDRYPDAWAAFGRLMKTERPMDAEHAILTAAGEERIVAWRNSVMRRDGIVVGTMLFGIDATDRRRAEAHRVAMEQVARRAEKLAALGTLSAGLAHELNNPIGIISSRIELMLLEGETSGLPAEVRDDLGVLHRQAQRVARITSGLLSFARQSSGERMPVDLNHIVRETLLLAEKQITKTGVQVTTQLDPALPAIMGDAGTLQQVVLNLVTNARDALSGEGQIALETCVLPERDHRVALIVTDTGHGIAPETIPRIFDPFFSTKSSGTGLGLSITDGIVRDHGGTIDVESRPGGGTRFVLTFPAVRAT